jgi:tRNA 2-thiocytidine biosynthesis protein TtcA
LDNLKDQVERGITTAYRKTIWRYFVCAVKEYQLIQPGDRVAVCVSGGKDSFLLAKCMQLLHRHSMVPFELHFLSMDPGFSPEKRRTMEETAEALGVPLHFFETDIFESIEAAKNSPCHVCASMRRGHLYKQAQLLGCNKIALGHHYDDVIETTMLSLLYGGEFKTMMPKLHSRNFEGMELIRPFYLVREEQVKSFVARYGIPVMTCACRVTKLEDGGKRKQVKQLIKDMKKTIPLVESSIFSSAQKVSLGAVLGWRMRDEGPFTSFLDVYGQDEG